MSCFAASETNNGDIIITGTKDIYFSAVWSFSAIWFSHLFINFRPSSFYLFGPSDSALPLRLQICQLWSYENAESPMITWETIHIWPQVNLGILQAWHFGPLSSLDYFLDLLWVSYSSWRYQYMASLYYGRAQPHGCTFVQCNIGSWERLVRVLTCSNIEYLSISSQWLHEINYKIITIALIL